MRLPTSSGRWVRVDGVGVTQARHLRELDTMVYDLIKLMTDADPSGIEVDYEFVLPATVRDHLARASELRAESSRANTAAAAETRAAARELADQGLPLRNIGRLLGVSHQRAGQLLAPATGSGVDRAS